MKVAFCMSSFNIAADLVDEAKNAGQLGFAGILVWMRFMATRQLVWNKNYNVKPRYSYKEYDNNWIFRFSKLYTTHYLIAGR